MVKSESHRDAEILVRNPSPRLFGKKFRDSKKVKTNHAKTRLSRFRDPTKIFRDPRFSRYHSPPLLYSSSLFGAESYSSQRERKSVWQGFQSKICELVSGKLSKCIFNNYSPKWRWLGVDIRKFTQPLRRRQRVRQKSNRFRQAKQQLCTCFTLFWTFLCRRCTTTT